MNQSMEDIVGEGEALLFFLCVLPCSVLPNNIFTCTFLLLAVGDLVSEALLCTVALSDKLLDRAMGF